MYSYGIFCNYFDVTVVIKNLCCGLEILKLFLAEF